MLTGLARPTLGEALAVKSCRHPIRDKFQKQRFIPNDIYATQTTRFQIVTGCNMSGKSTYIRSVALVQIMTQVGSFVPAAHASFPIVRQIFARTSTDDSLEENAGTFAFEMREMAFILRNVDAHSLVIVDELGRGTSSRDGLTIAIAVSEALMASGALVWFATHFKDLVRILSVRAGVLSLHMSVAIAPDLSSMTMLYRVAEGVVPSRNYGVAFARVFPFAADVLEVAEGVCGALAERAARRRKGSAAVRTQRRRKLLLNLVEQLRQAMGGTLEGEPLRAWLEELQREFAARMKAVDEVVEEDEGGCEAGD
jgi:DNA mismatch repair protein MSH4